jgi:hypothetical protein
MHILAMLLVLAADPFTGEPIPAASTGPVPREEAVAPASRENLTLASHIGDGATKGVRALGDGHVVFQNGSWLEFYDMSDPFEPDPRAQLLLQAQPSDMAVDGTMFYVAQRKTEGLLAVDVSDPGAPVVVGQREGYDMLSVAVGNGHAYCGLGTPGVVILNLPDLTTAGLFDTPGSANGTAVVGNTLYVAQGANGLGIFDVTNPAAVTPLGSYPTGSFCTFVQVQDNLAYLAGNFGLIIVDVTNPALPVLRGSYSVGDTTYEMQLVGDEVYIAGLSGGFRLDVSNPAAPQPLAQFSPASGFSIAVQNGSAFLAERFVGLRVLTADTLEALYLVQNAGFSMKLHLVGDLLYVVDLGGGVRVWDLSDPANPTYVSDTATPPNSQDLAVVGDAAFVVNSNNAGDGMWSLDVSVPSQPQVLATHNTTNAAYGIDVQNDRAYVANSNGGLHVANVADPANPAPLGNLPLGGNAFDVRTRDNVAYVAMFGGGLAAVDVTTPSFMSVLDQEAWGFLNALDVTGNYAWVADGQNGLRVVDITTPTNLVSVVTLAVGGQTRDVVHAGNVYLADDFYGLREVDVTNPAAPQLVASYPSADRGMGVDANDELVVLAGGEGGVYVYFQQNLTAVDVNPASSARLDAAPNPFNPQLEIRWELPAPASVRVAIHDARGRLVRELDLGARPVGTGSVTWNGTDCAGRACASGTYVLQLQAGAETVNRTVTLVR